MTAAAYLDSDFYDWDFRIQNQNIANNTDHIILNNTRSRVRVHVDHSAGSQHDVYVTLGPGECTAFKASAAGNNSTVYGYIAHSKLTPTLSPHRVDENGAELNEADARLTFSPF